MPTYEYAPVTLGCSDCAPSFETFQKLSEDALTHCPTCKPMCACSTKRSTHYP